jgi:hypothetical protein
VSVSSSTTVATVSATLVVGPTKTVTGVVTATATRTVTVTGVTTVTVSFAPLPLGGLSTLWTYVAYVVIFGGLGLDLVPGSKLRFGRKWLLGVLMPSPMI